GTRVVRADRVAARTAEEPVERLPRGLAAEVPQRDVDGRRGAQLGAAPIGADVSAQRTRMRLDLARVLAEQVAGDCVQVRLHRVGEEERLAEPDESLVGVDEDMDEAWKLVQAERVDAGDLHGLSPRR